MNVQELSETTSIKIMGLNAGDTFMHGEHAFLLTDRNENSCRIAVRLSDGIVFLFNRDRSVRQIPVKAVPDL